VKRRLRRARLALAARLAGGQVRTVYWKPKPDHFPDALSTRPFPGSQPCLLVPTREKP
jgi:hypothetical protein